MSDSRGRSRDCELSVRATPRASKNEISLSEDGSVRARVTAAPTDGQANEAVIEQLAKRLGIAKSRLILVRGQTSRQKTIQVEGLSLEEALAKLRDAGPIR